MSLKANSKMRTNSILCGAEGFPKNGAMDGAPLVSIIIPTFNTKSKWLSEAIQSVIGQTYQHLELLVVDDCSEIPFSDLQGKFMDSRIRWIKNRFNVGVSASRNNGARLAKGDYLAFLDSDDWWDKRKIELQLCVMKNNATDWCYTTTILCDGEGNILRTEYANDSGYIYPRLLKQQIVLGSCSGVLVKKKAFEEAGMFEESGDLVEDWDLWLKLARDHDITAVKEPLVYLRTCINSRSGAVEQKIKRLESLQAKYAVDYREYELIDYARAHKFYVMARQYLIAGIWLAAVRYLIQSLVACPSYYSQGRVKSMTEKIQTFRSAGKSASTK
jgi:teichuronic acid biosynthesis glycosyltransferase TuaG